MHEIATGITQDTTLCISLSGRPGSTGTRFHNYLYDALGLDFVYKSFTTSDIAEAIAGVRGLRIRGCAVSMPWKHDVLALVDEVDASAAAIDAVNTIVNTDGHLVAYNTDYQAVAHLLTSRGVPHQGTVAVLGSGGMAKATAAAAALEQARPLVADDPTDELAEVLADQQGVLAVGAQREQVEHLHAARARPVGGRRPPRQRRCARSPCTRAWWSGSSPPWRARRGGWWRCARPPGRS